MGKLEFSKPDLGLVVDFLRIHVTRGNLLRKEKLETCPKNVFYNDI